MTQLEQLLLTNREARSIYMAYMQIDSGLDWKIRGRQSVCGLADLSSNDIEAIRRKRVLAKPQRPGINPAAVCDALCRRALAASLAHSGRFRSLWTSRQSGQNSVAVADANHESDGPAVAKTRSNCPTNAVGSWRTVAMATGSVVVGDKIRLTRGHLRHGICVRRDGHR